MQKLMKNWIFTMITCILLVMLAVLMFLGALGVKGVTLAQDILHLLVAIVLAIYMVFTLFPLLKRRGGVVRVFVGVEIALLVLTIVGLVCAQVNVPFFSSLQVCSVVGLAIWLRGAVEIIHAYRLQGTAAQKKVPLWALCLYILVSAFGVWQMAAPSIPDRYFLFVIGAISAVMAAIFGYATAQNRRAGSEKREKKKKEKAAKKQAQTEKVPALPEKAEEQPAALAAAENNDKA